MTSNEGLAGTRFVLAVWAASKQNVMVRWAALPSITGHMALNGVTQGLSPATKSRSVSGTSGATLPGVSAEPIWPQIRSFSYAPKAEPDPEIVQVEPSGSARTSHRKLDMANAAGAW
jgi:hypothetical protein